MIVPLTRVLQLPDHVHRVYKASNRNMTFIAKRINNNSHEVKILQRLHSAEPGSKHIIRVLELIDTPSEQWIILPKLKPVYRMALGGLGDRVGQICSGLLDGLSYIHHLLIAHRDINPANLVVDNTFCLKIIDFEFAIQLNAEDEMVNDHCGTEGWVPPEVNVNFNSAYSPIRSDRWSCGCVILYLLDGAGKTEEHLRSFATRLMAKAPDERPQLSEWERVSQVRARSPEDAEARYPKKLRTDYHPSPHLLPRSRNEQDGEALNRADSHWGVVPPSVMSY
jgi:serine/threonine protein kinase